MSACLLSVLEHQHQKCLYQLLRHYKVTLAWAENELTLEENSLKILAADEYKLQAIKDILIAKLVRRNVSAKCFDYGTEESASHGAVRVRAGLVQGISKEKGKEIVKLIKETKLKVQAQIMEDQVRVTAKKIDDLQEVMQTLKGKDVGIELQFENMRS